MEINCNTKQKVFTKQKTESKLLFKLFNKSTTKILLLDCCAWFDSYGF